MNTVKLHIRNQRNSLPSVVPLGSIVEIDKEAYILFMAPSEDPFGCGHFGLVDLSSGRLWEMPAPAEGETFDADGVALSDLTEYIGPSTFLIITSGEITIRVGEQ